MNISEFNWRCIKKVEFFGLFLRDERSYKTSPEEQTIPDFYEIFKIIYLYNIYFFLI